MVFCTIITAFQFLLCEKVLGCILKTSLCVYLSDQGKILLGFDNSMSHMCKALTSNNILEDERKMQ